RIVSIYPFSSLFFFSDTPTPATYPLSLHDALPISVGAVSRPDVLAAVAVAEEHGAPSGSHSGAHRCAAQRGERRASLDRPTESRSEEHTSELQSRGHLVCRLLLEKKKKRE